MCGRDSSQCCGLGKGGQYQRPNKREGRQGGEWPIKVARKKNSLNWRWVEEGDGYVGRLQPPGQPLGVGLPSGLQCLVPYPYRSKEASQEMHACRPDIVSYSEQGIDMLSGLLSVRLSVPQ
jgi:hypothetical protein